MSQGMAGVLKELENSRKQILPGDLQKELSPAHALILAQGDSYWTSDLQNCKIISLNCFSHQFVITCYSSNRKLIQVLSLSGREMRDEGSTQNFWCSKAQGLISLSPDLQGKGGHSWEIWKSCGIP